MLVKLIFQQKYRKTHQFRDVYPVPIVLFKLYFKYQ